jgi:hypothetical protein
MMMNLTVQNPVPDRQWFVLEAACSKDYDCRRDESAKMQKERKNKNESTM